MDDKRILISSFIKKMGKVCVLEQRLLFILMFPILLHGCGKSSSDPQSPFSSREEVAAPPQIGEAFRVEEAGEVEADPSSLPTLPSHPVPPLNPDETNDDLQISSKGNYHIFINRNALEKEFLLQAEIIRTGIVPLFNGLKSRVVAFRKRGNQLYMLEATQGHVVTRDIPQHLLLAQFPILEEKDGMIRFDFNHGFSHIFMASDWYTQDNVDATTLQHFKALRTEISYLENASFNKDNQLFIHMVAQVVMPLPQENLENRYSVGVKYYLSPYRPNPDFKPTTTHKRDFDWRGYFEVSPQYNLQSGVHVYASKFDHKKSIVFALSSEIPAEYKEAVKEGVLYWNTAFGEEVVKVVEAPPGRVAPDIEYNMVQWVNWDRAGYAYADAQMDPRNGEILHAQVFMPSAFAFGSRFRARQLYHMLKEENLERRGGSGHDVRIFLKGFYRPSLCEYHSAQTGLMNTLHEMLEENLEDSVFLRVAQDYVREVISHEIGHVLGLRHNFAGSLAANFKLEERDRHFRNYLKRGRARLGLFTTSSIMEYQNFVDGVLSGSQIPHLRFAYRYDKQAIQYLYYGKNYPIEERPLFCTDSHLRVQQFLDCQIWDSGHSTLEFIQWDFEEQLRNVPRKIIEEFIYAKSRAFGMEPTPLEKVMISPSETAEAIMQTRHRLMRAMTNEGKILLIQRHYPLISELNQEEIREKELDFLLGEVERLQGFNGIMPLLSRELAEKEYQRFTGLLDSGKFDSGLDPTGAPYVFTAEDKVIMKNFAKIFYQRLQEELFKKDITVLSGQGNGNEKTKWSEHPLLKRYDQFLLDRSLEYALNTKGILFEGAVSIKVKKKSENSSEDGTGGEDEYELKTIHLQLPDFSYPFSTIRVPAAKLHENDKAQSLAWGHNSRLVLKERLRRIMEKSLGGQAPDELLKQQLPEGVQEWILQNQAILKIWK